MTDENAGEAEFSFTKLGNAQFKHWDNTLIGRALIGSAKLTVETNSERRANDLRERIEQALGDLIGHRLREHSDPESLMDLMPPERNQREEPHPELQAVVRELKEKHMAQWLDDKIPALDGLTPREAAARPAPRTKLDLLLRNMEHRESRLPPEDRFDVNRIREQLGLAP